MFRCWNCCWAMLWWRRERPRDNYRAPQPRYDELVVSLPCSLREMLIHTSTALSPLITIAMARSSYKQVQVASSVSLSLQRRNLTEVEFVGFYICMHNSYIRGSFKRTNKRKKALFNTFCLSASSGH